jgi:ketosteroid isomerase-like protein
MAHGRLLLVSQPVFWRRQHFKGYPSRDGCEERRDAVAESFEEFMRRREAASNAYIAGDPAALQRMLTHLDPATFMPPGGAIVQGAAPVEQAQVGGAATFGPRSTGHFEVFNSGSSGDLAFWTGRQVASMDIRGQEHPVEMVLRTTEIFRREGGEWKLVHLHADTTPPPEP